MEICSERISEGSLWHTCYDTSESGDDHMTIVCLIALFHVQANFRDMGDHRAISKDEVLAFVDSVNRWVCTMDVSTEVCDPTPPLPPSFSATTFFHSPLLRPDGSSEVMYAESSMKNAFGLMHLHKFLSIPFLQLQVHTVYSLWWCDDVILQQDMLLQQIKVSREQMMAARDELVGASNTEDQNYEMWAS